jgi:Tfp pilus assembly protein PilN
MAGVNLSQSMASQADKSAKRPFSVSSFPLSIILLLITFVGWGGLRWYLYSLNQKITQLDETISASGNRLQGENIDRIADFDARSSLLGVSSTERVDPVVVLSKIETLIVPEIVLTKYEYNKQEKMSLIAGETDNFRFVAEQIINLKSDSLFSQVVVDQISRSEEGKIQFVLRANF